MANPIVPDSGRFVLSRETVYLLLETCRMECPKVIIAEREAVFDDWLERFIEEQRFAAWWFPSGAVRCSMLRLTHRDHKSRRRYELKRGDQIIVELERMPRAGGLEIRVALLVGLAPEQPLIFLGMSERDGQPVQVVTDNPADAGFCAGFYREMNTVYEPDWFDLPKLSYLPQETHHFSGSLTNLQIAELVLHCYTLMFLEKRSYADPEMEAWRLEQLAKHRNGLPSFQPSDTLPLDESSHVNNEAIPLLSDDTRTESTKLTQGEMSRMIHLPTLRLASVTSDQFERALRRFAQARGVQHVERQLLDEDVRRYVLERWWDRHQQNMLVCEIEAERRLDQQLEIRFHWSGSLLPADLRFCVEFYQWSADLRGIDPIAEIAAIVQAFIMCYGERFATWPDHPTEQAPAQWPTPQFASITEPRDDSQQELIRQTISNYAQQYLNQTTDMTVAPSSQVLPTIPVQTNATLTQTAPGSTELSPDSYSLSHRLVIVLQAPLINVIGNVNLWNARHNLTLTFHGRQQNAAIWGASNCIIAIRAIHEKATEIELYSYKHVRPDAGARAAWNHLGTLLVQAYQCPFQALSDSPLWAFDLEETFIEAVQTPDRNPLPDEVEWKAQRRAEYRDWAEHMADSFRAMEEVGDLAQAERLLTVRVDQEWQTFRERIEQAKAILRARAEAANKTTAEAAEDYFAWVATTTAEVDQLPSTHRGEKQQTPTPSSRRGGPVPTPLEKQREYVMGWLEAQQKGEPQEVYCSRKGIGASTLRGWMRAMRNRGELPSR